MTDGSQKVSLGFTQQEFPLGVHICQIFGTEEEREESLLKFLLSGLQQRGICV